MIPTVRILKLATKAKITKPVEANMISVIKGLETYGEKAGLDLPHRYVQYLAQLGHESGGFRYDRELWGPTAAQKKYEGRKDLGNTQPGDGKKFMGRTGIQLTGRGNVTRFRDWVWKNIDPKAPDFVENPELLNTDPWEGLVPIWFWTVGNRTGKSLNQYADLNDIEMITRIVNGGLNGFDDRIDYYNRFALVTLGYSISDMNASIRKFQEENKLEVDGDPGPQTRARLHQKLAMQAKKQITEDPAVNVKSSPVTEKVTVSAAPEEVKKPIKDQVVIGGSIVGTVAASPIAKPALDLFGNLSQLLQIIIVAAVIGGLIYVFIIRGMLAKQTKVMEQKIEDKANDGLPS